MSTLYRALADTAAITALGVALLLRDTSRMPAWAVLVPGALYSAHWAAAGNRRNAAASSLLTAAGFSVLAVQHRVVGGVR